jgi:hypothetical protein
VLFCFCDKFTRKKIINQNLKIMKTKNLKSLKLNKKSISNLKGTLGGRPSISFRQTECTCSPSELTHCLAGCTAASYDALC